MEQNNSRTETTIAFTTQEAYYSCSDISHSVMDLSIVPSDRKERLKLAVDDLRIGKRIYNELKEQGRTVSWLARQLCMERTSLYYIFRQNSVDMELLLRISYFLEHNFLLDVAEVYQTYRL